MTPAAVDLSIRDVLARAVQLYADDAAVLFDGRSSSWADLQRRVFRLANALHDRGIRPGDRLGIGQGNGPEIIEAVLATALLGAVMVPLSTRLSRDELRYLVSDAGLRMAFVEPGIDLDGALAGEQVVHTRCAAYDAFVAEGADAEPAELERADMPALQLYTSGTTGRPKGAVLTQRALVQNGLTTLLSQGLSHGDVFLSATPLAHAVSCTRIVALAVDGITHAILPRFTPAAFFAAVASYGVTTTVLVPTMLADILDDPGLGDADLSTLRLLVYGAAPCPEALIRRALATLPCGFLHGYGQTEACPAVTQLTPDEHRWFAADSAQSGRLGSIGRPVPGVRIRVADDAGNEAAPGTPGELQIRSTKTMVGYWKRDDESADALRDGWLRTGDVAVQDEGGYLFLVDRKKDMLISGGLNVYPSEIERVLREVAGVRDIAVVGAPDERWGEAPVAFFVPADGHAGTHLVDAMARHCRAALAGYKQPREFVAVDELPRNATGKVLKQELRRRVAERPAAANA
ncbi:MAG: class I adenylate-forming enzyme family protein [Candidatus Nanopelagicales bacterium]